MRINRLHGNLLKIFSGTMASRFFGFIREMVTGAYLGTSKTADAISVALMFPNLFRQILGEDMVERAFMPPFKTMFDKGDEKKAWRFLSALFNWFFFSLLVVMTLLYFVVPLLFSWINQSSLLRAVFFKSADIDYGLTLEFIYIILPYMVFIGIAAFVGSLLNFFERNWIFAFAPISLSLGVVFSILFLRGWLGYYSIAVGYLLGAFLQMTVQVPFLFGKEFKTKFQLKYEMKNKLPSSEYKTIKRESAIIALNSLFNKSSEIFGRLLAFFFAVGAASSIFYAQRLLQLPFAIVSLTISRALNPILNQLKAVKEKERFTRLFNRGLDLNVFIFIPVTTVMMGGAEEIVNLIYARGQFQEQAVILTGAVLRWYALGLTFMGMTAYYTRVLSLFQKNRYSLYISIISAIINIGAALLLMKKSGMGHEAIALANSISFFVNTLFLIFIVKKEFAYYSLNTLETLSKHLFPALLGIIVFVVIERKELYFLDDKWGSFFSLSIKALVVFSLCGGYFGFLKLMRRESVQ